jgi:hypothetical protein
VRLDKEPPGSAAFERGWRAAPAFYLDVAPGLEESLLVVRGPRAAAPLHHESLGPSARQLTLTTAGMVAVVTLASETSGVFPAIGDRPRLSERRDPAVAST